MPAKMLNKTMSSTAAVLNACAFTIAVVPKDPKDDDRKKEDDNDSNSTEPGDCRSTRSDSDCDQSAPSSPVSPIREPPSDPLEELSDSATYSRDFMMRARPPLTEVEQRWLPARRLRSMAKGSLPGGSTKEEEKKPALSGKGNKKEAKSSSSSGWAPKEVSTALPVASATSWAAALAARRARSGSSSSDDVSEVAHRMKSLLNKLTPEKFESLYAQLREIGISNMELLLKEIFEKATTQHHYTSMYANLCERLGSEAVEDTANGDLSDILDNLCRAPFEQLLQKSAEATDEEDDELRAKQKLRALGNIRFAAELIVRGIMSSKLFLDWSKDLVQEPLDSLRLEALAVFLSVAGPRFDTVAWPMHRQLREVFWQVRGFTFDTSMPARVRCLLRDVLDCKDAGWVDVRKTVKVSAPKTLSDVQTEARVEAQRIVIVEEPVLFVMPPPVLSPVVALEVAPPAPKKRMMLKNKSLAKPDLAPEP